MLDFNVFSRFKIGKNPKSSTQIADLKIPEHLQFSKTELSQFREIMKDIRHAVVVSHIGPDVDALMSITSLSHVLQYNSMGTVRLVYEDYILEELKEHQTTKLIELTPDLLKTLQKYQPSHVFLIDINHVHRLTRNDPTPLKQFLETQTKTIILDHHDPKTVDFKAYFQIIKPYASATELLFYLIKALDLEFNALVAQDILAGILSDTAMLRYSQTAQHDLQITLYAIQQLINAGANFNYAVDLTDYKVYPQMFKYIREYMDNLVIDGKIAYTYIKEEASGENRIWIVRARQYIMEHFLKKLTTPIVLTGTSLKNNTGSKISIRSKPPYIINKIAEEFGGGGHPYAAGIFLRNTPLDEILPKVLEKLQILVKTTNNTNAPNVSNTASL